MSCPAARSISRSMGPGSASSPAQDPASSAAESGAGAGSVAAAAAPAASASCCSEWWWAGGGCPSSCGQDAQEAARAGPAGRAMAEQRMGAGLQRWRGRQVGRERGQPAGPGAPAGFPTYKARGPTRPIRPSPMVHRRVLYTPRQGLTHRRCALNTRAHAHRIAGGRIKGEEGPTLSSACPPSQGAAFRRRLLYVCGTCACTLHPSVSDNDAWAVPWRVIGMLQARPAQQRTWHGRGRWFGAVH